MKIIFDILKSVLKIGRCETCADFSFKLRTKSYDKKLVCKECLLDINTSIEI